MGMTLLKVNTAELYSIIITGILKYEGICSYSCFQTATILLIHY